MFLENWQIALIVIIPCFISYISVYVMYLIYCLLREKRRQKNILLSRVSSLESSLRSYESAFFNNFHEITQQIVKLNKEVFKDEKHSK